MIEDDNNTFERNVERTQLEHQSFTEEKELELRMYFFVPYNISPIQQGIQAGHALGRYCLMFGRNNPNHMVWDFLEKFETWIILNGGTTNASRDFDAIPTGSLNKIGDQLQENDIEFSFFVEPDLNDALTALCLIVDERVFNRKEYPDFINFVFGKLSPEAAAAMPYENEMLLRSQNLEKQKEMFPEYYKEWVRLLGGLKNVFLRELTKDKKKA